MGRPWTVFDAHNREHRKWFAKFQASGTWGTCPVRFVIADDHGDLVTMIQRRLIEYYVSKEFSRDLKAFSKSRENATNIILYES